MVTKWLLSAMVKGFPVTKDVTGWAMKCAPRKEILLAVVELPEGGEGLSRTCAHRFNSVFSPSLGVVEDQFADAAP